MLDSHKTCPLVYSANLLAGFYMNVTVIWYGLNKIKYYFLLGMIHSMRTQSSPKN